MKIQNTRPIYIHTNLPAPYRQHLFECIASKFPNTKVFFSDAMHGDRCWEDDYSGWKVNCTRLKYTFRLPKIGRFSLGLIIHILRQPRGVIHLIGDCGGNILMLLLLGRIRGGRLVMWNDGGFLENISIRYKRFFIRWLKPAFCAIFTPGHIGASYAKALGFSQDQIFNSFLSHDANLFDALRSADRATLRATSRNSLGIGRSDFVMITVSRFLDWKRLEDLSASLQLLDNVLGTRAHIIIIGTGKHIFPLQEIVAKVKTIQVHHIATANYADMPSWYAAADILIFPSEGDIWGLVVNEALSMGVPVICTDRIGASELVADGVNGFKVSVRRPDEIAMRVTQLFRDQDLLMYMTARAPEVVQRWNSNLAINELQRLSTS